MSYSNGIGERLREVNALFTQPLERFKAHWEKKRE